LLQLFPRSWYVEFVPFLEEHLGIQVTSKVKKPSMKFRNLMSQYRGIKMKEKEKKNR
jgi:hypothetical protein